MGATRSLQGVCFFLSVQFRYKKRVYKSSLDEKQLAKLRSKVRGDVASPLVPGLTHGGGCWGMVALGGVGGLG